MFNEDRESYFWVIDNNTNKVVERANNTCMILKEFKENKKRYTILEW